MIIKESIEFKKTKDTKSSLGVGIREITKDPNVLSSYIEKLVREEMGLKGLVWFVDEYKDLFRFTILIYGHFLGNKREVELSQWIINNTYYFVNEIVNVSNPDNPDNEKYYLYLMKKDSYLTKKKTNESLEFKRTGSTKAALNLGEAKRIIEVLEKFKTMYKIGHAGFNKVLIQKYGPNHPFNIKVTFTSYKPGIVTYVKFFLLANHLWEYFEDGWKDKKVIRGKSNYFSPSTVKIQLGYKYSRLWEPVWEYWGKKYPTKFFG